MARAGVLVGIWVIVGIVSAVQIYFLTTWAGGRPDFLELVSRQVRNALPWIAITLFVFALARRFQLRSLGVLRWVALHAVVGVCTVVALNVVQTSVHWLIEGPMPGYADWGDAARRGRDAWLPRWLAGAPTPGAARFDAAVVRGNGVSALTCAARLARSEAFAGRVVVAAVRHYLSRS